MTELSEIQELRKIAREQQEFSRIQQEQLQQANANVLALTTALQQLSANAIQSASATATSPKKKPDLPSFDKKNVEVWIKRVEATYALANITSPTDKFAYLQSKFDVAFDPRINAFLYGDATQGQWDAFLEYLTDEYGPTIRQRAQKYIADFPRNGRRPTQHLALLQEETKGVTIDDIQKEIVLKGVPSHIRQIMGSDVDQLSAQEVAEKADAFFDREGKLLERPPVASVSHVSDKSPCPAAPVLPPAPSFTATFSDVADDVNAVGKGVPGRSQFRQSTSSQRQQRPGGPSSTSASGGAVGGNNNRSGTSAFPNGSNAAPSDGLCMFHRRFKERATRCVTGCPKHAAFIASHPPQQGNGNGGRRM